MLMCRNLAQSRPAICCAEMLNCSIKAAIFLITSKMYNHMKSPVFFFALLLGNLQLTAQCLSLTSCPVSPLTVCDSSFNDALLWNESTWYDATYGGHDPGEASTDLSMQLVDTCGGSVLASYVLFLDLDGDGVRETAISSAALPAPNAVFYNNAANPNYAGGELRHFDERPVTNEQKYAFALEQSQQGNTLTARVRWTSTLNPGAYVNPQLPAGTHRIEWRFEKNGEVKTCAYDFVIKDCAPPTVVCLNGLSVNIMPTQMIQLWATDFLQYALDNITPTNQLVYGVRRAGTGVGFPMDAQGQTITNVIFTCADLGMQPVELWTIDAAGNASYCETSVLVQDNNNNCHPVSPYTVCLQPACSLYDLSLEEVGFEISGSSPAVPPLSVFFNFPSSDNCANFDLPVPGNSFKLTPYTSYLDPLSGLSTYDLALLNQHILGTTFTQNWQWVAADADLNGVIDTNDVIRCRALMLGILDTVSFPAYRFYPLSYVFPAGNPLALPVPNYVTLDSATLSNPITFVAVKACDVSSCNVVGVNESAASANVVGQPKPNPTAAGITILCSLQKSGTVVVEILDLTGRSLYKSIVALTAGEQQLEVPQNAFPQAGMYLWRVQVDNEVRTGKVVKQ